MGKMAVVTLLRVDGGVTRTQSLEWNQPHIMAVTGANSFFKQ